MEGGKVKSFDSSISSSTTSTELEDLARQSILGQSKNLGRSRLYT
jgi:hypothetical protein